MSSFFILPPEVRILIYKELLVAPSEISPTRRRDIDIGMNHPSLSPAILRTCRAVHNEAHVLLYGDNKFSLYDTGYKFRHPYCTDEFANTANLGSGYAPTPTILSFLEKIGPANLSLIRTLEIDWEASANYLTECPEPLDILQKIVEEHQPGPLRSELLDEAVEDILDAFAEGIVETIQVLVDGAHSLRNLNVFFPGSSRNVGGIFLKRDFFSERLVVQDALKMFRTVKRLQIGSTIDLEAAEEIGRAMGLERVAVVWDEGDVHLDAEWALLESEAMRELGWRRGGARRRFLKF